MKVCDWAEERRERLTSDENEKRNLTGGVKYSITFQGQTLKSNKLFLIWMKINCENIIQ